MTYYTNPDGLLLLKMGMSAVVVTDQSSEFTTDLPIAGTDETLAIIDKSDSGQELIVEYKSH